MDRGDQKTALQGGCSSDDSSDLGAADLRRGPWTVDEDLTLINYIAVHGEGRWNSLARCAGLKRTGKSCRLRWLNYLRPDVRRGNITLEEQLLILELHSRWGNRWSKIAQFLPGRTDNEIKNYWRTRVQKHAKQLKCDVNSKQFKDTMRYLWMPRLVERIQAAAATTSAAGYGQLQSEMGGGVLAGNQQPAPLMGSFNSNITPDSSINTASSDGAQVSVSDFAGAGGDYMGNYVVDSLASPCGYFNHGIDDQFPAAEQGGQWYGGAGDTSEVLWNAEDTYFLQQQFNNCSTVNM